MESYRDIYWRFIENYRTDTGGINIYPQFDNDLDALLEWLENDDAMGDWTTEGTSRTACSSARLPRRASSATKRR